MLKTVLLVYQLLQISVPVQFVPFLPAMLEVSGMSYHFHLFHPLDAKRKPICLRKAQPLD